MLRLPWISRAVLEPKSRDFFSRLLFFSALAHVIVVLMLFFIQRSSVTTLHFSFDAREHDAPVIMVPSYIKTGNNRGAAMHASIALKKAAPLLADKKKIVSPDGATLHKSSFVATKPVAKKLGTKIAAPKKTIVQAKKKLAKKKSTPNKVEKPKTKKNKIEQKVSSKKVMPEPLPIQPVQEVIVPPKQVTAVPQEPAVSADSVMTLPIQVGESQRVLFVNPHEAALMIVQREVEEGLKKLWQGPLVKPVGAACQIKIKIGADGLACDMEQISSCTAVAYDVSAWNALSAYIFPEVMWNKEYIISF